MNRTAPPTNWVLLFWFFNFFLISQCGPGQEDTGNEVHRDPDPISNSSPYPPESFLNCAKGTLISYENFGSGFIGQYCLTCHSIKKKETVRGGAPIDVNFDTAREIQMFRASILARTRRGQTKPMPPNREIPASQFLILTEWLDCGAPEKNK
jgi:hypothetical protein